MTKKIVVENMEGVEAALRETMSPEDAAKLVGQGKRFMEIFAGIEDGMTPYRKHGAQLQEFSRSQLKISPSDLVVSMMALCATILEGVANELPEEEVEMLEPTLDILKDFAYSHAASPEQLAALRALEEEGFEISWPRRVTLPVQVESSDEIH